ncbi:MAG: hypothetical protein K0B11_19485 [Mariniphaga sp.]|nr:hypothetical protein [Mariniphaga sp.]
MLVSIIAPLVFLRIRLGTLWIIVFFNAEICRSFGLLLVVTKLISRTGIWPEIGFTSSSCSEEILYFARDKMCQPNLVGPEHSGAKVQLAK